MAERIRRLVDYLAAHSEPVSRWEFRVFAGVGIALALTAVCLFAYMKRVEGEQMRTPETWQQIVDDLALGASPATEPVTTPVAL